MTSAERKTHKKIGRESVDTTEKPKAGNKKTETKQEAKNKVPFRAKRSKDPTVDPFVHKAQQFVDRAFEYDDSLALFPFAQTYNNTDAGMLQHEQKESKTSENQDKPIHERVNGRLAGLFVVLYTWKKEACELSELHDAKKSHERDVQTRWRPLADLRACDDVFLRNCVKQLETHDFTDTIPVVVTGTRFGSSFPMVSKLHWIRNRAMLSSRDLTAMTSIVVIHCQVCGKHPELGKTQIEETQDVKGVDYSQRYAWKPCPRCNTAYYCSLAHLESDKRRHLSTCDQIDLRRSIKQESMRIELYKDPQAVFFIRVMDWIANLRADVVAATPKSQPKSTAGTTTITKTTTPLEKATEIKGVENETKMAVETETSTTTTPTASNDTDDFDKFAIQYKAKRLQKRQEAEERGEKYIDSDSEPDGEGDDEDDDADENEGDQDDEEDSEQEEVDTGTDQVHPPSTPMNPVPETPTAATGTTVAMVPSASSSVVTSMQLDKDLEQLQIADDG